MEPNDNDLRGYLSEEMLYDMVVALIKQGRIRFSTSFTPPRIRIVIEGIYGIMREKLETCDLVTMALNDGIALEFRRIKGVVMARPIYTRFN